MSAVLIGTAVALGAASLALTLLIKLLKILKIFKFSYYRCAMWLLIIIFS
jgi:undecaprenyl pyrophosphate phosphatase UppP